ncbi:hypothetical protein MPSEU_000019700 [Mayamaea pseudoterrestris]|nr:hypothetical protein MPSEU_000019700 [Mayamaea pseudoterrestris]
MQSVMESLCRCFGSAPMGHHDLHDLESLGMTQDMLMEQQQQQQQRHPATPHKRTMSLGLRDKQWDALFSHEPQLDTKNDSPSNHSNSITEPVVSKTNKHHHHHKQHRHGFAHKRKRSCSRDDIFRTKKLPDKFQQVPASSSSTLPNPLSRFLSSHPVIAHTLCFASPIKDSDETDHAASDATNKDGTTESTCTVVSEANSLNNSTADDTMTSTVYYETTKLAGLFQKTPPMPLFKNYILNERDDIQQILHALQSEQRQLDELVTSKNYGRLEASSSGRERLKKDLFGAKELQQQQQHGGGGRKVKTITLAKIRANEQAPPAVYCSSSNSSENSDKNILKQGRFCKQPRKHDIV